MIYHGDCLEIMPTLPAESVDSIVTDPPYGFSFMGKSWDHGIPGEPFWREALRIAKPGTHLLAFGGTRTFHRLTCAIEDAGWEIRDCIMWVYGSGFPKSHDVSKAIDQEAGAERKIVGLTRGGVERGGKYGESRLQESDKWHDVTAPATPAAEQWQGWGTALKPAWEPIIVARKPLAGTVAQNVQEYGTGAVNVDGCRVGSDSTRRPLGKPINGGYFGSDRSERTSLAAIGGSNRGRWPANLIHDGSDEVVGLFPSPHGAGKARNANDGTHRGYHDGVTGFSGAPAMRFGDSGSAARFFYCAKASKADRDEGNRHPTVKPTALMRYLCRLVTPPDGIVFDPFCGSGSTGKAATLEGFRFIGIEREAEYVEIAKARIAHARGDMPLLANA